MEANEPSNPIHSNTRCSYRSRHKAGINPHVFFFGGVWWQWYISPLHCQFIANMLVLTIHDLLLKLQETIFLGHMSITFHYTSPWTEFHRGLSAENPHVCTENEEKVDTQMLIDRRKTLHPVSWVLIIWHINTEMHTTNLKISIIWICKINRSNLIYIYCTLLCIIYIYILSAISPSAGFQPPSSHFFANGEKSKPTCSVHIQPRTIIRWDRVLKGKKPWRVILRPEI